MAKEIILDHKNIQDPQTITQVTKEAFESKGLDIHTHEVEDIDDDFRRGKRRLRVKNTKYFAIGNVPWHK